MENLKKPFIKFLIECGALKFGSFVLKSGKPSPFFIDIGQISTGKELEFMGDCLAHALKWSYPDVTMLFGPAYKGIPMAAVVAASYWRKYQKDLAVFYDRKEKKSHGEGGSFIGKMPKPEDKIVIIDDVFTDGGTKIEAFKALESTFKVKPLGVLVTVNRSKPNNAFGFPLCAIVNLLDIRDYLSENDEKNALLIDKFMEGNA